MGAVPVIDVSGLGDDGADPAAADAVAAAIDAACRDTGFFSVVGHGVPAGLRRRLEVAAGEFFVLPEAEKAEIAMARGGRAWRGWFPLGGELTSGVPDHKEGIYFGQELAADHPAVVSGTPMHGPNLFPARPPDLRAAVLEYVDAVTGLGQRVLEGIALGLGLDRRWFRDHLTADPLVLFRIFRYPSPPPGAAVWGVGEHTDYGLITLLGQDRSGGLEVRSRDGWIDVPPDPEAFVVNLGDMLERMTGGAYRSTPHRARNPGATERLSFPLFLDPGWDADVLPVPGFGAEAGGDDPGDRWDGRSVHDWRGTYGAYLLSKVGRVFPDLRADALADPGEPVTGR